MTVQIPLKKKYRAGGSVKQVSGKPSGNGVKKRPNHHKLSDAQRKALKPQTKRILVMLASGKKLMMNYDEAYAG